MPLTPDQAKPMICPVRRKDGAQLGCAGDRCMAWRWSEEKRTKAFMADVVAHMKATGANHNAATQKVFADKGETYKHTEGFCGLAGEAGA